MHLTLACVFSLVFGICFANHNEPDLVCGLPAEPGMCYAYFPMFYYDSPSGDCIGFTYGGCGGNENRFWTKDECLNRCGGHRGSEKEPAEEEKEPIFLGPVDEGKGTALQQPIEEGKGDISQKPVDEGKGVIFQKPIDVGKGAIFPEPSGGGKGAIFLQPVGGKGVIFQKPIDGGKAVIFHQPIDGGKGVIFHRDACNTEKVIGPCRAFSPRFYFNKESGECEQFIYGGCRGNHNNFRTKEECQRLCTSGKGSPLL